MKYAIRLTNKRTKSVTWVNAYFYTRGAAEAFISGKAGEWRDCFIDIRTIADVPSPTFISETEGFK